MIIVKENEESCMDFMFFKKRCLNVFCVCVQMITEIQRFLYFLFKKNVILLELIYRN